MKYITPEMESMNFMAIDVITSSNGNGEVTVDPDNNEVVLPDVGGEDW